MSRQAIPFLANKLKAGQNSRQFLPAAPHQSYSILHSFSAASFTLTWQNVLKIVRPMHESGLGLKSSSLVWLTWCQLRLLPQKTAEPELVSTKLYERSAKNKNKNNRGVSFPVGPLESVIENKLFA